MKKLLVLLVLCIGCGKPPVVVENSQPKLKINKYVVEKYVVYDSKHSGYTFIVISNDGFYLYPKYGEFIDIRLNMNHESENWSGK